MCTLMDQKKNCLGWTFMASDYDTLVDLIMASDTVVTVINCAQDTRVRKAIAKNKNERGILAWKFYKLRYTIERVPQSTCDCELTITRYRIARPAIL